MKKKFGVKFNPSVIGDFNLLIKAIEHKLKVNFMPKPEDKNDPAYNAEQKKRLTVRHPLVRANPVNGLKNFYAGAHAQQIEGMDEAKGYQLLTDITAFCTQPQFVLRHRWRPGDVLLWDNRATMHFANDDYGTAERKMRRVTIRGSKPFGPSGVESRFADDPLTAIR